MSNPIAVLISDVHYSLTTLELADNAFRQAIDKAYALNVPLIDCGDLTNDKAILRAEVVNRLISTMEYAKRKQVPAYLLVGNHSLCNERGKEHALEFLRPYVSEIIDSAPTRLFGLDFIPYCSSPGEFLEQLKSCPKSRVLITHQGLEGALMGTYVQDKSAVPHQALAGRRIISGHYHARQDIQLPSTGLWSYVGNPYTLNFGEANDSEKGFQVLNDDGSLTFVPTNLRKHLVYEITTRDLAWGGLSGYQHKEGDLLWIKLSGPRDELDRYGKGTIAGSLGTAEFKLDKTATDSPSQPAMSETLTGEEIMDSLVDVLETTGDHKATLKRLWRDII